MANEKPARAMFAQFGSDMGGESGDPFHRLRAGPLDGRRSREDLHDELDWDLRALEAADPITDERAAQAGVTNPVAGFYPSLHLNMGECYRKFGDRDESPRAPQGRSSCCRQARRRRLRQRDPGRTRPAG